MVVKVNVNRIQYHKEIDVRIRQLEKKKYRHYWSLKKKIIVKYSFEERVKIDGGNVAN